jgi:Na+/glutamate symporter
MFNVLLLENKKRVPPLKKKKTIDQVVFFILYCIANGSNRDIRKLFNHLIIPNTIVCTHESYKTIVFNVQLLKIHKFYKVYGTLERTYVDVKLNIVFTYTSLQKTENTSTYWQFVVLSYLFSFFFFLLKETTVGYTIVDC